MTTLRNRNGNRKLQDGRHFERRERWSRSRLLATTGLGGALAGLALGGGNAWGQVGANTLPTGGQVVAGQATINQQGANTLNINQSSDRAVINWSSFDVGSDATVNFHQPNSGSWTLNRVTNSVSPSQILGTINANGNIVVINPNGVIFGAGSRVDVNGLIATTSNISDQNFMAGTLNFDQPGNPSAMVVNEGDITVRDAGLVAFVAPGVSNSGTITANLGRVSLASGTRFTVDLYGDSLVSIAVGGETTAAPVDADGNPVDALVSNSGRIIADGGRVQMTARQASRIVDAAINMSGLVQARTAYVDGNGDIVLDGGQHGDVTVSGTLDASGEGAGRKGGSVAVVGKQEVRIAGTARIDASGSAGGGTVKIGGDLKGGGTTPTARNTTVAAGAQIAADAIVSGDGGTVIVWADDTTLWAGHISVRGGAEGGNGGFAEVSGRESVLIAGSWDGTAVNGDAGTLLIDPASLTLTPGGNDGIVVNVITDGTLNNLLGGGNVTLSLSGNSTSSADQEIEILTGVTLDLDGNLLTLIADDSGGLNIDAGAITIQTGVVIANGSLRLEAGTVDLGSAIGATIVNGGANAPMLVNVTDTAAVINQAIAIAGTNATVSLAAGTYDQTVTINKALTLQGAAGNASIITRTAGFNQNLITVTANDVTIDGLRLDVARPFAVAGIVAVNPSAFDDLVITNNIIELFNAAGGSGFISPLGNTSAVGIALLGNGGMQESVVIQGNTIGSGDGVNTFSRGIWLREVQAVVGGPLASQGNTITATTQDLLFGFPSDATGAPLDPTLIQNNTFLGHGVDITEPNGNHVVEIRDNLFAPVLPTFSQSLMIKHNYAVGAEILVDGNTFTGHGNVGIFVGNSRNVTISNNSFEAAATSVDFAHILVDTGYTTGGAFPAGAANNPVLDLTLLGNEFFGNGNPGEGRAILMRHTNAQQTNGYSTIQLGQLGQENIFHGDLQYYVYLADVGETFAFAPLFGPGHSNMVGPFSWNVDADQNFFQVTSGLIKPTAMDAADLAEVEAKIQHFNDNALLGLVAFLPGSVIVDMGGLDAIQMALDAGGNNVVIFVDAGGTWDGIIDGDSLNALTIANENVQLISFGGTATLDFAAVNGATGINVTANDVIVEGFNIVGTASLTQAVITVADSASGVGILNNAILSGAGGVSGILVLGNGALVQGNTITGSGAGAGRGILVDSSVIAGGTITGVTIDGNVVGGFGNGAIVVDPVLGQTVTGNTITSDASHGIQSDSPVGNVVIADNTVNNVGGNGILVNDGTGTGADAISIVNNTIGNDNSSGDIAGAGIRITTVAGYGGIVVSANLIGTGMDAAMVGDSGIWLLSSSATLSAITGNEIGTGSGGIGDSGIRVDAHTGDLSIGGNFISGVDASGIAVTGVLGAASGVTVSGDTISDFGNVFGDGIHVNGVLGASSRVVIENVQIDGNANPSAQDGVELTDVRSGTIANAQIENTTYGILVSDATDPAVPLATTISGTSISNVMLDGIRFGDPNASGTSTLFFGAGNVVDGATRGVRINGAATRVGSAESVGFNDLILLNISGNFIQLESGAVFLPGQPTVINASNVGFDINNNGMIDADENFSGIDPSTWTTQAELDDFWTNVAPQLIALDARIVDYRDDPTLGFVSPLGDTVVVYGPTDFGGGLLGVQNAINLTPSGGVLLVNSGTYGAPDPDPIGTLGLVIAEPITMIGRQGFVSAVTGGRTAGGVDESILNFDDDTPGFNSVFMIRIDSSEVTVRGFDITGDATQTQGGVVISNLSGGVDIAVTNNFIRGGDTLLGGPAALYTSAVNIQSGNFDGNNIFDVLNDGISLSIDSSASSFELSGNRVRVDSGAGDDGIRIMGGGGVTELVVSGNTVENAGAFGIVISGFSFLTVSDNTIDSATPGSIVGQDGIRITGGSAGLIENNIIAASGVLTLGGVAGSDGGIRLINPSGNFTVSGNVIGDGDVGIFVENSAGSAPSFVTVSGNTLTGISTFNEDGIRITNVSNNDMTVILASQSISNFADAGIEVTDTTAAGITYLDFNAGVVLNNGARGVVISGASTRIIGNTFDNLVIGSGGGSITGNFIELQNAALHGNPNGTPFDPLEYNAQFVTFNGVVPDTLDPAGSPANQAALAALENRIVHYLDTTFADYDTVPIRNMRGLIRLRTDSFSLDDTVGLNGVQLAITASNPGDTIYLAAGSFADPSDLLPVINFELTGMANDWLLIDRPINIIGANAGTSAVDRLPFAPVSESVLDFVAATGGTDGAVVIASSGVFIDGIAVFADGDQAFGIRIDASMARSNIQILNTFVLGDGSGNQIAGNGIETVGAGQVSNLTIVGNVIDFVDGSAVALANVRALAIQNNLVGTEATVLTTVGGHGFTISNATYATSVSGNSIFDTGLDGIALDNAGYADAPAANFVSVTQNTFDNVGGSGISINGFRTVAATDNTIGTGAQGIGNSGILVSNTGETVTITGNLIENVGNNPMASAAGIGVTLTGGAGLAATDIAVLVGDNVIIDNNASGIGLGIFVGGTANGSVSVVGNSISGIDQNHGIYVWQTTTGDVWGVGNSIDMTGDVGLWVDETGGSVTLSDNSANNTGEDGLLITDTTGGVFVFDNLVGNTGSIGLDSTIADAIQILNTGGDVTVQTNTIAAGAAVDRDGVRVFGTGGNVSVFNNRIGAGGNLDTGDGIHIRDTGLAVSVVENLVINAGDDGIAIINVGLNVEVIDNVVSGVGGDSNGGDGILVTNTGTAGVNGDLNGTVRVLGNRVTAVTGDGGADAEDGMSRGDGIRVSFVDGDVIVGNDGNTITNVDNDGIQISNVAGNVSAQNNTISMFSQGSTTGDGIEINFVGMAYHGVGLANANVVVLNNRISTGAGTGAADLLSDGLSGGDGIRASSVDGVVTVGANSLISIGNDGIQLNNINGASSVVGNSLTAVSTLSGTGDGIVVENTGGLFAGNADMGEDGSVYIASNFVFAVVGAAAIDTDTIAGGAALSAGDGIRVGAIDGDVVIGEDSATRNTVSGIAGDGIQVFSVTGNGGSAQAVLISHNLVTNVGTGAGGDGDGIVVSFTGAYASDPLPSLVDNGAGNVVVRNNVVNQVAGNGPDRDDGRSAGDGIRIRSADGTVEILDNQVGTAVGGDIANDGIQVWDVTRSVVVSGNTIGGAASIGVGASGDGDGIVVENTGIYALKGGPEFLGAVSIVGNSITNVAGPGNVDADGGNFVPPVLGPENAPVQFLSAGDGIRAAFVDGAVLIDANTVLDVAGDGIQAYYVGGVAAGTNAVVITNNAVTSVGNGSDDGDGIVVSFTGDYGFGAFVIVPNLGGVLIDGNVVNSVIGDGVDRDDGRSAGDGIRVRSASGNVTISNNEIGTGSNIDNDGIQVWDVTRTVVVSGNTIGAGGGSIGTGASGDGDGIVVENTGTITTGGIGYSAAGAGSVTVTGNLISNVYGTAADDADGVIAAIGAVETNASAGDGIRVAFVDGDVRIDGNNILNVADDGIQVLSVTGNGPNGSTIAQAGITIAGNIISSVGNGSGLGDGIVVAYTGITDIGSVAMTGGVLVAGNVINDVFGDGTDEDGFSAGDGIRLVFIDGDVVVRENTIASTGDIANDGIQISLVGKTVQVLDNRVGAGGSIGTGASGDGDGIVINRTGALAGGFGSDQGGQVTVSGNIVFNVVGGSAGPDGDDGFSSGDGLRILEADGNVVVSGNGFSMIGDDGIQIETVRGIVSVIGNGIATVGNVSMTGDGIVVSRIGVMFAGGMAQGGVFVDSNTIIGVTGDGLNDPDDPQHSNGDGIRIVRVDGNSQSRGNVVSTVSDDGIYHGVIKGTVDIRDNSITDAGLNSATGDGIVVGVTGSLAGGTAGGGSVTILSNTIQAVAQVNAGAADFDNPNGIFGGDSMGFSAGDGIRAHHIDGNLVIGVDAATGNTITDVGDDGIQIALVRGNVGVAHNRISNVGTASMVGDGIVVQDVGMMFAGGGPAGVSVVVDDNTIANVTGDGLADPDDAMHSNGDGIRIVRVDGSSQSNDNTISGVDDDGIYHGVIKATVNICDNRITNAGLNSATGDGIVVGVTGSLAGGAAGAGSVTVLNNTIANVFATNAGGGDFDNPNGIFGGLNFGFSAGDGIRLHHVDGDAVVGVTIGTGNSIANVDDDGIQIAIVRGGAIASFNRIEMAGVGSNVGDGIVIQDVGAAYAGGSVQGVVAVNSNVISDVNGDGLSDPDDSQHSTGDGIRVVRVDGWAALNNNTISNVDDDGIYVGVIRSTVNITNNRIANAGMGSDTGDGIVVGVTGSLAGGLAGGGSATILNNTIVDVSTGNAGAMDFDDPNGIFGGLDMGFSAGDGIRAHHIDGNLTIGDGATTGNSVSNADDDGIQVAIVRGSVGIEYNRIDEVGLSSGLGDGIVVQDVGMMFAGGGPAGVAVSVNSNTISNVTGDGLADPDDAMHSNGDGIRIVRVDGSSQSNTNTISNVDDDGIYHGAIKNTVDARDNRITNAGMGSDTGDGIVVGVTGSLAGGAAGAGSVTILNNTIAGVSAGNAGGMDFDDPNGIFVGVNMGFSAGDGIRAHHIDGNLTIGDGATTGNFVSNADDDGIQVDTVRGSVIVLNNAVDTVGGGSGKGDGIVVANIGNAYAGGGPAGVTVLVNFNTISTVDGDGLGDPDDALHSSGDGIRIVRVDGSSFSNNNIITDVGDDGVYVGVVRGNVNVRRNVVTNAGLGSATGDGIVVSSTGSLAGGAAGAGSTFISGNTVTNVLGTGAADFDMPAGLFAGGLSSGDGIRFEGIDGDAHARENRVTSVGDDGIQGLSVTGNVLADVNLVVSVSNGGLVGDGIVIETVDGSVTVNSNSIADVLGDGSNDPDGLMLTAGDGIRVTGVMGAVIVGDVGAGNSIGNVGDDGIQINNVSSGATVSGNRIVDAGQISDFGDGIVIEFATGAFFVSGNTIANVDGANGANGDNALAGPISNDGIRIGDINATGGISVANNVISNVNDDGIEISSVIGNVFVTGNRIDMVGGGPVGTGDGILVTDLTPTGGATVTGNTISNVLSANAGTADANDGRTAGDGIRVTDVPGNVLVGSNTVVNAADDGIQVDSIAGTVDVLSNRIDSVGNVSGRGDGIQVSSISNDVAINMNVVSRVTGAGFDADDGYFTGDGIRATLITGTLQVNGNTITTVDDQGIHVEDVSNSATISGNVIGQGMAGPDIGTDGIYVNGITAMGSVTVNSNVIRNVGQEGIYITAVEGSALLNGNQATLIGDKGFEVFDIGGSVIATNNNVSQTGDDGILIYNVGGSVNVSSNVVSGTGNEGIEVENTGTFVNANANTVTGSADSAIQITNTSEGVTVSGNVLNNNGTGGAGDTGIFLEDFASAVVTSNTIMNVTAGSLGIGIDIGNVVAPLAMITIADNVVNDSGTGLFVRDNVMGTVTGNTFQNNVVWGVQIDNGVSGNGIGMGEPGDVVPTLDIWFRENTIAGNGVAAAMPGVDGGGINNLRPGPLPGGFIFDARGNDFAGQTAFTTGTHFENPNSGGLGDAVSDWVRIDVVLTDVEIPYYDFGSLLDNFGRGGGVNAPGDLMAVGPSFDRNGSLFDPFFANAFATAFGLAGDATQAAGASSATDYAMCYLADMWQATSCRVAPPEN